MMDLEPIAHIRTDFKSKFGIPRQSCIADGCTGKIVFEKKYRNPESLRGIEGYNYIWIIFDFSESHSEPWSPTVRPPRLGGNKRIGVFATRSPFRPNSLGLSSVKLKGVENTKDGCVLVVEGADLLDGTPIYDIKPYLKFTDSHPDAESGFADDVFNHKLDVQYEKETVSELSDDELKELVSCLVQDPRPQYQDDGRLYRMDFSRYVVTFSVSGDLLTIVSVETKINRILSENP